MRSRDVGRDGGDNALPTRATPAAASTLHYRVREGHVLQVDDGTSARMASVRQRGTRPERVVRAALRLAGKSYRLHNRDLPGSPDAANRKRRWAIFVHGCFWHRHGCKASTTPRRNAAYWQQKFSRNVARDQRAIRDLEARGFLVLVVWECETRGVAARDVAARLRRELPPRISGSDAGSLDDSKQWPPQR